VPSVLPHLDEPCLSQDPQMPRHAWLTDLREGPPEFPCRPLATREEVQDLSTGRIGESGEDISLHGWRGEHNRGINYVSLAGWANGNEGHIPPSKEVDLGNGGLTRTIYTL
jgi:hypothetical protein